MLPKDPAILLSVVNTKLRDDYADLEDLCAAEDADRAALETYKNDPRHKAVSALCKSIRTDRAAVDCLLPDPEE